MKHGRTITIKNPTLKRLRNNLRIILREWKGGLSKFYSEKYREIGKKLGAAKNSNDEETFYRLLKESRIIENEREKLIKAFFKSIYQCK